MDESNQGNPAARHCTGMSAVAERGMVTRLCMRGTEIYIFHEFQVVRSVRSRNQGIRALTEKPPHGKHCFLTMDRIEDQMDKRMDRIEDQMGK